MRFEKLVVWHRATDLSVSLYRRLAELRDYGFRDQITRSGLSIPSNIAEGMERDSDADRVRFLRYAKGSCAELHCQIHIGMRIGYVDQKTGLAWLEETEEISRMLWGLIKGRG